MISDYVIFSYTLHLGSQFFSLFHDLSDSFWMTVFDTCRSFHHSPVQSIFPYLRSSYIKNREMTIIDISWSIFLKDRIYSFHYFCTYICRFNLFTLIINRKLNLQIMRIYNEQIFNFRNFNESWHGHCILCEKIKLNSTFDRTNRQIMK